MRYLPAGVLWLAALAGGAPAAPAERATIILDQGESVANAIVLEESAEVVAVDVDADGREDMRWPTETVQEVRYTRRPAYVLEARLFKDDPASVGRAIALYERVYDDQALSPWHRQHIYYEAAAAAARWAGADAKWLATARRLYERLVADIPKTRYRAAAEFWLAEDAWRRGERAAAEKRLTDLAAGAVDRGLAHRAALRLADLQLAGGELAAADAAYAALIDRLDAADPLRTAAAVGRGDCAVRAGRLADGRRFQYDSVAKPMDEATSARLYRVLGDADRLAGRPARALEHYLRVVLLYPADPDQTAAALCGAVRCGVALERPDLVRRHLAHLRRDFAAAPCAKALVAEIKNAD